MSFDAQMKFAGRMAKKRKITVKQLAMTTEIDLPTSTEMDAWLGAAMHSAEDGYLDEMVSNPLAKPLDSISLYTPLGAIATSQYAAVRPVESTNEREEREFRERKSRRLLTTDRSHVGTDLFGTFEEKTNNYGTGLHRSSFDDSDGMEEISLPTSVNGGGSFNTAANTTVASYSTTWSAQAAVENRQKPMLVNAAMKRLEVLWLQRRAKLEMDEGNTVKAISTLKDALEIHVGTDDYSKADLGSHMLSEPEGLLNYIAETYFDFDKTAHFDAGRIQRCVLRWLKRRHARITKIQKFFRGFLQRKAMYQKGNMRKQCAIVIQRVFRRFLGIRCYYATKIKSWYKKLKMMEDFKIKIYYFRNAYRIQRLYRGYTGRVVAALRRKELDSTSLVQRQGRAWRIRHQRAQALRLIHRRYHFAARIIQCAIRRVIAVKRCQIQLLNEMFREEERLERETGVVDEAIKLQLKKVHLYMGTESGKVHFETTQDRIRTKDKHFKKIKKTLSEEAVMAHEAMVSFELFDTDGSGQIDEEELSQMLVQLAIPMNEAGVKALAAEIDADGSGDIDFGEFMDWYTGGGSQDIVDNQSYEEKFFKRILKARTYVLEITGVTLHQRATRDMLRQVTTWQSKDIAATFRNTYAPKFQCCQCMEPFVFFTDYREHFDKKGRCGVNRRKAIYFPKFWEALDWNYQRQVEKEIRRFNDEIPNINYNSLVATFKDVSLQSKAGVQALLKSYINKAQIIYMNKFQEQEDGTKGPTKTMGEEIVEVVKMCGDEHLNPIVAFTVAECIGSKIPEDWIVEDRWEMDAFSDWVEDIVDKGIALKSVPLYKKCLNQEYEKLKQDTLLLATVYVRVVRLLQVATESSLIALMECRSRRPRTVTIPDKILIAEGLEHLTKKAYVTSKNNIVEKLNIINAAFEKMTTIYVPSTCETLLKRTTGSVPVGPDGKLSDADLRKVLIHDAHIRAQAQFQSHAASKIGYTQMRRLANELWAMRLLHQQNGQAIASRQGKTITTGRYTGSLMKASGDILYLYERFASAATGDGIDVWELELVQRALTIRIPDSKWSEVQNLLDPKKTGYVTFDHLFTWMIEKSHKKYFNFFRGMYNVLEYSIWVLLDTIYMLHAEQMMLTQIRKISRLELDYQNLSMEALLLQAKLPEDDEAEVDVVEKPLTISEEIEIAEAAKAEEELDDEAKALELSADAHKRQTVDQIEADKARIIQLQLESEQLNEKIVKIKNANEEGESLLLFRLEEAEAEERCKRNFFSRQGLYNLKTEMKIMKATNKIIEAYGYCISPGARYPWTSKLLGTKTCKISQEDIDVWVDIRDKNIHNVNGPPKHVMKKKQFDEDGEEIEESDDEEERTPQVFDNRFEVGWALALSILVYAYDTDCSGTFDEGEVKLLLSNSLCGLHERKVLMNFPEVKDESATLHTMVNYLAMKVNWGRGKLWRLGYRGGTFILTKPSLNAAASMLISLSRQYARAKAEEAAELARTGKMKEEDDAKNDDALMMRAQMLAMRQVDLYFKTIQGRFKYRETKKKVRYWWNEDCWRTSFSREGLFSYAYQVHAEWKGVLITELPHLIRFCVVYLRFYTTSYVSEIAKMIAEVRTKDDVYWLSRDDVIDLLDKALAGTASRFNKFIQTPQILLHRMCQWTSGRDATLNMYSKARQQAVLISLQFEGILVADSNYRCSVLGLHDVMHHISQTSSWGLWKPKIKHKNLTWKKAPREATMFLLLSKGYSMDDLLKGGVDNWCEVEHLDGGLAADVVDVRDCLAQTNTEVSRTFRSGGFIGTVIGLMQSGKRWLNYGTQATGGLVHYFNYKRVGKALMTEGKQVNKEGAKYLREIISGQSHCVTEDEEE